MRPENRQKLEKYRHKLNEWVNDQTCHLDVQAKQEIIDVIREEFDPGYVIDMYCGSCVVKMMEYAFRRMDETKVDTVTVDLIGKKKKK